MAKRGRKSRYEGKTAEEAIRMTVAEVQRREGMTPCWEWQAGKDGRGYGWITFESVKQHAHRLAFSAFNGPIPAGMKVLHECDNPACCNPTHLKTGTQADNIRAMHLRGRGHKGTGDQSDRFRNLWRTRARDETGRFV